MRKPLLASTATTKDKPTTKTRNIKMLSEQKLTAILNFKMNKDSSADLERLMATGEARQLGLLNVQNELKPEYQHALDSLMRHVNVGLPVSTAIAKVKKEFEAPPKSYAEMLDDLLYGGI